MDKDDMLIKIIKEIHKEGLETEIYEYLHKWVLDDRTKLINEASEDRAVINIVRKLAKIPHNQKAIIDVCTDDDELISYRKGKD